jgi:hypothetical protein
MTFTRQSARAAALTRWALEPDRVAATQAARDGRRAQYARRVDPFNRLPLRDRESRIDALIRADMIRMAERREAAR